jgi:Zn-dependent protease with chaperone function
LTALQTPKGWALAAVSAKPDVQTIKVRFPDGADKQHWRLLTLASAAPTDNNEDAEQVRILETPLAAQGGELGFAIPAYGFVVVSAGE